MANSSLIACPECDLLHRIGPIPKQKTAVCHRCGAFLRQGTHGSLDIPFALSITGLVLFGLANLFPLLVLEMHGSVQAATMTGCVRALVSLGWPWLAAILITTVIIAPPVYLGGLAYVLFQAKRRRPNPLTARVFRIVQEFQEWGMAEVFILAILVAYVKLTKTAVVVPGPSLFVLAAFSMVATAVITTLDANEVWDALGELP